MYTWLLQQSHTPQFTVTLQWRSQAAELVTLTFRGYSHCTVIQGRLRSHSHIFLYSSLLTHLYLGPSSHVIPWGFLTNSVCTSRFSCVPSLNWIPFKLFTLSIYVKKNINYEASHCHFLQLLTYIIFNTLFLSINSAGRSSQPDSFT